MASNLIKIGKSDNIPICTYNVDTEEDMNTIDLQGVPMGSKCYIINDGKWYMLNGEGKWKAMALSGGGDGGSVPKPLTYDYMPEGYPKKAVQTTTLMEEQELAFTLSNDLYIAQLTNAFKIVDGQTYTVNWDGAEYECVGAVFNSIPSLGNISMMGAGVDTGEPFIYVYDIEDAFGMFATHDTAASHTISVKRTEEIVTPIDEKYLPDNLATKSDVEATQEVFDGVFSSVATFTFDKQTSGRDTFNLNGFNYYKISDFNPASEDVISFKGTRESGEKMSEIVTGNNCVKYGFFIVVASAGRCFLPITETDTDSFIAPSAGLYASYEVDNIYQTAGTGEFTLRASTGSSYITGLLLKSSTANSTKKFKITVDDTGDAYVDSTSSAGQDASSKKLASEEYVDSRLFTFTIMPTNGSGSQMLSATRAEMLSALDAGKTLLGYWTETRTILGTTDTIKHEFRLESVSGTGADRGLAFVNYEQFYKSTLYVNGNDTVSFVNKEQLPNPTTKTEAMTQSVGMDDDGRLWTEPGASGGGVTTLHINVTAVKQDTLQATFTADKTPSEMQQAAVTGPIWCVITFASGILGNNPVTFGLPPAWYGDLPAFGYAVQHGHKENGNNDILYAVRGTTNNTWLIEIGAFGS